MPMVLMVLEDGNLHGNERGETIKTYDEPHETDEPQ